MKQARLTGVCAATLLALGGLGTAQASVLEKTDVQFGGYLKADIMFSDYSNGAPDSNNVSRQFYVPGAIYGRWQRQSGDRLPGAGNPF